MASRGWGGGEQGNAGGLPCIILNSGYTALRLHKTTQCATQRVNLTQTWTSPVTGITLGASTVTHVPQCGRCYTRDLREVG